MNKKRRPDLALDRTLRADLTKRIADDNEPIRVMLAMLRSVNEFTTDLALDEPVTADEGLTGADLAQLLHNTGRAITTLETMYRRMR